MGMERGSEGEDLKRPEETANSIGDLGMSRERKRGEREGIAVGKGKEGFLFLFFFFKKRNGKSEKEMLLQKSCFGRKCLTPFAGVLNLNFIR